MEAEINNKTVGMTFSELVNWYLFEGVSKEQKEKGQKEMNKIESNPFYKLREYLLKMGWKNIKRRHVTKKGRI